EGSAEDGWDATMIIPAIRNCLAWSPRGTQGSPGGLSKSSRTFRREKFSAFVHTETTPLTTVSLLHSCRGESFDVAGVGKRFVRADRLRLDRFFEECGRQNRPFGARFCDAGRDE